MSTGLYLVVNTRGERWDPSKPLDQQELWDGHARFMDALTAERFVVLGGPILGTSDALLVVRARDEDEIERRLAQDPWRANGLLRLTSVRRWELRLGSLP